MASIFYNEYWYRQHRNEINLLTDTIKVALLYETYTPNKDSDTVWSGISSHELPNGNGYTTGGETLTSPAISKDLTNDRILFDAADITTPWSTGTFSGQRYAVIYRSNLTQYLIACIDLNYPRNGPMSLIWAAAGIFGLAN